MHRCPLKLTYRVQLPRHRRRSRGRHHPPGGYRVAQDALCLFLTGRGPPLAGTARKLQGNLKEDDRKDAQEG